MKSNFIPFISNLLKIPLHKNQLRINNTKNTFRVCPNVENNFTIISNLPWNVDRLDNIPRVNTICIGDTLLSQKFQYLAF